MIAKWIAKALSRGEDHLTLTTEELAIWQANGCRVGFGAPYGANGGRIVQQIYSWRHTLIEQLKGAEPGTWPTGFLRISCGNSAEVVMPELEFEALESGKWRVPMVPRDPNHSVDTWAFDLDLTSEELEALRPVAARLVRRMLLRCEIKNPADVINKSVPWNDGRTAFLNVAGVEEVRLCGWFSLGKVQERNPPKNADTINMDDPKESLSEIQMRRARNAFPRVAPKGQKYLSKAGPFIREMHIRKTAALSDSFNVKFTSMMLTSRHPRERLVNLDFNLSTSELLQMKVLIEESLGLAEVPLHVYPDIAMGVVAAQERQEQEDGND